MTLVIIDFNRTIYDPDSGELVSGAKELIEKLKEKGARMVLVSRQEGDSRSKLTEFGIDDVFAEILFVEEKTGPVFSEIIARHGATPEDSYVLGDHLHQEIRAGNQAGAFTIHFKHGRFAELLREIESDQASATIDRLSDAFQFII